MEKHRSAPQQRDTTVGGMILRRIASHPSDVALRFKEGDKDGDRWRDVRWAELGARMERIAAGLLTALDDLDPRAAITIIGNTSYDWIACDFAALSVGLRTVPVYATLLDEEVGYMHVDTDAVIAIAEDATQVAKLRAIRQGFSFFDQDYAPERLTLQHIVVMDPSGLDPDDDDWESLADLEARGAQHLDATAERRRDGADAVSRDDTCTYTYTSGTTGPPKAAIQSNDNMLSMQENIHSTGLFDESMREGGFFLFLPLAHSFGRLIEQAGPFLNVPIVISSVPSLLPDLLAQRPGFFPAAPRVYEKMKSRIETKVAAAPKVRKLLFQGALKAGKASIPYRSKGKPLPRHIDLAYKAADKVVLSKLRAALGLDRARVLLSGSAPLSVDVHEFFLSLGFDLLEAYGLTETCPGLTANLPGDLKLGTVGRPLPGVDLKIASDGEILAKAPNIIKGYLNRDEATHEAFDDDGWFHTGDLGAWDDGFVKITGRKKELMKTSGGKYIAPTKIEGRLKNHPLIQEAVAVADRRNFATALIAIDPEELTPWAEQHNVPPDRDSHAVKDEIQRHVDAVNKSLASFETIKYFRLVPPMTVEDGFLTASLKVKRRVVHDRYADLIDSMYSNDKP